MIRTLRLIFKTDAGKNFIVSMNYCKGDVSAQEATDLANALLDEEIFAEALVEFSGADLTQRTTSVLV